MLKLPLQYETRVDKFGRQVKEADAAAWWSGQNVATSCKPGGLLLLRQRSRGSACHRQCSGSGLGIEEAAALCVEVRAAANANFASTHRHSYWRFKRLSTSKNCRFCLVQHIRGLSPKFVILPVSYATATSLERCEGALSPATNIEEKERLLNALVGSAAATVEVTNHRRDTVLRGVDSTLENGRAVAFEGGRSRDGGTGGSNSNCRKKWELSASSLRLSSELEQRRMEWKSDDFGHNRGREEKILLLESLDVDTTKVLAVSPEIALVPIDTMRSVIYQLETVCGLRRSDLGRILSMTPQILLVDVENHLRETVKFLVGEVGLHRKDLRKVIKRCPRLLVASADCQMRPTMHFLESLGFNHMAALVCSNATLLTCGIQNRLLPKLGFLQNQGLSRDDAVSIALRFPAIFNYGVEQNLRPKFDYLTNVMGYSFNQLKSFPQYFGYSLEDRIRPRHEFLHSRNIRVPLSIFLKLTDGEFYRRFKGEPVRGVEVDRMKLSSTRAVLAEFDVATESLDLTARRVDESQSDGGEQKEEDQEKRTEALYALKQQQSEAAAISSACHQIWVPVAVAV